MDRVPARLAGLLPVNAPEWVDLMKRQILEMLRDGSISAALATLVRKLKIEEKRAEKIHEFCRYQIQFENLSDGDDSE